MSWWSALLVGYEVDPAGSLADGVHTVSDAVALRLSRPVPARTGRLTGAVTGPA